MPKNLNSFILSDNTINVMKNDLEKTKEIGREIGFNLCQIEGTNVLTEDDHCVGSECRISLSKICKTGKKVGLYHTHPGDGTGQSKMSLSDIETGYYYGISCIGGMRDQKIRCFVRKDKIMRPEDFKIMHYHKKRFEPLQESHVVKTIRGFKVVKSKFRERDYIMDKLTDRYFNVIDIYDLGSDSR